MTDRPEVTFIICTFNRAGYLDDTISSLLASHQQNLNYELLIVDNNSTDDTTQVVGKHQESFKQGDIIRCIKEFDQGLSCARNRGIQEARADHIVFLDDDIRAEATLIPAWISFFRNHPEAVAAGGKIHVQFDDPRPGWMSYFLLPLLGRHDLGDSLTTYPRDKYPFGGNMGFRKSVFREIGGFDTGLGRKGKALGAGEEKELFRRIRSRSSEIFYLPEAFLYHRVNAERLTIDYIRKQALGLGRSMKLQFENVSPVRWARNWGAEIAKLLASIPLAAGYLLMLQPSKASMLFRFRWWIWKGYREQSYRFRQSR